MRIVAALGGNALLRHGEPLDVALQRPGGIGVLADAPALLAGRTGTQMCSPESGESS